MEQQFMKTIRSVPPRLFSRIFRYPYNATSAVVLSKYLIAKRSLSVQRSHPPRRGGAPWIQHRDWHSLGQREATIYALSTAPGRAAIAVIRVSGPACVEIYNSICPQAPIPKPRYAATRTLYDSQLPPNPDSIIDPNAVVIYFRSPKTVTGEDVLEFHVHGGTAIVKAVLQTISKCAGPKSDIRYAEPGEFTRRAFLNNRLDLTQVEALGDALAAVTEQQRRLSVRGTGGKLAHQYESWRQLLLAARGELEAIIDFSEDQHFDESPATLASSVAAQIRLLRNRLEVYSANAVKGDLLRNGITVSLLGAPNAGKSSLLNRIVGREAAIVSKEAGTTRDVVEVGLDIGGWYCRIGDMAGLRKATYKKYPAVDSHEQDEFQVGDVEREGIKRAKQRTMESDVVIVVLPVEKSSGQRVFDLQIDDEVVQTAVMSIERGSDVLVAVNKTDQIETLSPDTMDSWKAAVQQRIPSVAADRIICISCQPSNPDATDPGNIQAFLRGLMLSFENMTSPVKPDDSSVGADPSIWQESLGASERHRLLLSRGQTHLNEFLAQVTEAEKDDQGDSEANFDIVVAAESLRSAADCLGKITGKAESGDVEEVLGVVFEKFCVGK